jgi:hypothetical protein
VQDPTGCDAFGQVSFIETPSADELAGLPPMTQLDPEPFDGIRRLAALEYGHYCCVPPEWYR